MITYTSHKVRRYKRKLSTPEIVFNITMLIGLALTLIALMVYLVGDIPLMRKIASGSISLLSYDVAYMMKKGVF